MFLSRLPKPSRCGRSPGAPDAPRTARSPDGLTRSPSVSAREALQSCNDSIKDDQHLSNLSIAKQANQIIASDQVIESNVQFLSQACIRIGGSATTHELVQKDTSPSNSIYSTSRPQVFWEVRLREARAGKLREEVLERLAVEVLESLEPLEHRNYPFASICQFIAMVLCSLTILTGTCCMKCCILRYFKTSCIEYLCRSCGN